MINPLPYPWSHVFFPWASIWYIASSWHGSCWAWAQLILAVNLLSNSQNEIPHRGAKCAHGAHSNLWPYSSPGLPDWFILGFIQQHSRLCCMVSLSTFSCMEELKSPWTHLMWSVGAADWMAFLDLLIAAHKGIWEDLKKVSPRK